MKPTKVRPSEHTHARGQLCLDLGLFPDADDGTLLAEVLRAVVSASATSNQPVSHHDLIDRVMRLLIVFDTRRQSDLRRAVEDVADLLAAVGDLARLVSGSWRPAETNAVQLHGGSHLLISGAPLRALPIGDRSIRPNGVLRVLVDVPEAMPIRSVEEWIGPEAGSLRSWTSGVLESDGLHSVPTDLMESADFTFYRPDAVALTERQAHRWRPTDQRLHGRRLMRIVRYPDVERFAIAELDAGQITSFRPIRIDAARRLCFGIDAQPGRPVSVSVTRAADDVKVTVRSAVPARETRALAALTGTASTNQWTADRTLFHQVRSTLGGLDLTLPPSPSP